MLHKIIFISGFSKKKRKNIFKYIHIFSCIYSHVYYCQCSFPPHVFRYFLSIGSSSFSKSCTVPLLAASFIILLIWECLYFIFFLIVLLDIKFSGYSVFLYQFEYTICSPLASIVANEKLVVNCILFFFVSLKGIIQHGDITEWLVLGFEEIDWTEKTSLRKWQVIF